jgi:hypothetical protein
MRLVNRVVPKTELSAYVQSYAETIADNAPLTVRAVKCITTEILKGPGARDMDLCEALVAQCYASEDHREGRRAFIEKRKPVFKAGKPPSQNSPGERCRPQLDDATVLYDAQYLESALQPRRAAQTPIIVGLCE